MDVLDTYVYSERISTIPGFQIISIISIILIILLIVFIFYVGIKVVQACNIYIQKNKDQTNNQKK